MAKLEHYRVNSIFCAFYEFGLPREGVLRGHPAKGPAKQSSEGSHEGVRRGGLVKVSHKGVPRVGQKVFCSHVVPSVFVLWRSIIGWSKVFVSQHLQI